LRGSLRGVA